MNLRNIMIFIFVYIYRPQTKLGTGNVFTPVCDSVHREGEMYMPPLGRHPLGRHPLGRQPLLADDPPGRPPLPPYEMVTAADGANPTGMHSCFNFQFVWLILSMFTILVQIL